MLRKLERKFRASGLNIDHDIYNQKQAEYELLKITTKTKHYTKAITDCNNNQGAMFSIIKKLLHHTSNWPFPTHESPAKLTEDFASFFEDKVAKIHRNLQSEDQNVLPVAHSEPIATHRLESFAEVTEEELREILAKSAVKSCPLDPVLANFFMIISDSSLKTLTLIVNHSLASGIVPETLKKAMISPILKKPPLDPECLSNYCPVSNLPFMSKLIEKVVADQLVKHLDSHTLAEPFESAYCRHHSTETALLCVTNDILLSLDRPQVVLLVLLDLSVAFDTVDHEMLLARLSSRIGLCETALNWARSYLKDRTQFVSVSDAQSTAAPLSKGVPQGSVLGPIFFTIYMLPPGDIVRRYGMSFHLYADDTQLYLSFDTKDPDSKGNANLKLESCITEIRSWMLANRLKLNDDKTEYLQFLPHLKDKSPTTPITIGTESIDMSLSAKNLGILFGSNLSLLSHINTVTKAAYFQLNKISRVKRYLTPQALRIAVHALISSKVDYCNSLLFGLPK